MTTEEILSGKPVPVEFESSIGGRWVWIEAVVHWDAAKKEWVCDNEAGATDKDGEAIDDERANRQCEEEAIEHAAKIHPEIK